MMSDPFPPTGATPALGCPKCHGTMRSFERAGIRIDQCEECRGIFLDRGELELLLDLEARTMAPRRPDPPAPERLARPAWGAPGPWDREPPRERDWDRDRGFGMRDRDDDDDDDRRRGGRRRGGFLSDLLDFD
jgi:Zn-finger nucleic acid-binding protein